MSRGYEINLLRRGRADKKELGRLANVLRRSSRWRTLTTAYTLN